MQHASVCATAGSYIASHGGQEEARGQDVRPTSMQGEVVEVPRHGGEGVLAAPCSLQQTAAAVLTATCGLHGPLPRPAQTRVVEFEHRY